MQRPDVLAPGASGVERVGRGLRLRIHLDHGAQGRTLPVEGVDPVQAGIGDGAGGLAAVPHRLPQGVERNCLDGGPCRRAYTRLRGGRRADGGQRAVAQEVAATDPAGHLVLHPSLALPGGFLRAR